MRVSAGEVASPQMIECGEEAAKHFAFDEGYINLNHGSYGTHPIEVRTVHRQYQERAEARPDTFVRYEFRTHLLDEARRAIADYVHAPVETCVLVPNASTGIDAVLRNIVFEPFDAVVCFSTIYPAFSNTLDYLAERCEFSVYIIEHVLPLSDNEICSNFERMLEIIEKAGKKARLAIFDTISSLPAVRMPFERLTKICRTNRVLSCIDGAHGWLFTPRGCAVLYIPIRNQYLIRSTIPTGFNFLKKDRTDQINNFVANFAAVATSDDTPYLCIPAALEWRKRIIYGDKTGEEVIIQYNKDLARRGGQLVAEMLGTEDMDNDELTLGDCAMTNVRLPVNTEERLIRDLADRINKTMNLSHNIAVNAFAYGGKFWVRLSAQVYLEMKNFEAAGLALQKMFARHVKVN